MAHFTPSLRCFDNWDVLLFDFSRLGAGRANDSISSLPNETTMKELFVPWLGNPPPKYHLKRYLKPQIPSENSILTCLNASNSAINRIFLHYSDPLQELILDGDSLRCFCEQKTPVPYEYVEYYLLVKWYFEMMLPFTFDYKILHQIAAHTRSQTALIIELFEHSDEYKQVPKIILKKGEAAVTTRNKINNAKAGDKRNDADITEPYAYWNIRQCLFCGEFYQSPIDKNNNYSRYCDDPKCEKAHKAWTRTLYEKLTTPSDIGL